MLVGGGTGGHFYPLISIAEALRAAKKDIILTYAGPEKYDSEALITENIDFLQIPAGKRRRYASLLNVIDLFRTFYGAVVAIFKIYVVYPDVVMSKGGYTSVPVVLAARFLNIPIVVHESDSVPGTANKFGARFARTVITSYPETHTLFKNKNTQYLGIPIRKSLLLPPSVEARTWLNIDATRPVLLFIGGSQGAERINELILISLGDLIKDFSIIHQTGKTGYELCKKSAESLINDPLLQKNYHATPFLGGSMLNDAYHMANIVISRAGSNSIHEIALHSKPSILIPIPQEISHDQRSNAYAYSRIGAATVMEESNLTHVLLRAEIDRIMQSPDIYKEMSDSATKFAKNNAAETISTLLLDIAKQH